MKKAKRKQMPPHLPPLPEGWVYVGCGNEVPEYWAEQPYLAYSENYGPYWRPQGVGGASEFHYALPEDSPYLEKEGPILPPEITDPLPEEGLEIGGWGWTCEPHEHDGYWYWCDDGLGWYSAKRSSTGGLGMENLFYVYRPVKEKEEKSEMEALKEENEMLWGVLRAEEKWKKAQEEADNLKIQAWDLFQDAMKKGGKA